MRIFIAAFVLVFGLAATAYAQEALTEQQVESVQTAIKGANCTVEDTGIKVKHYGYKALRAVCSDGTYDIKFDKDFKIIEKKKKDAE